MDKITAEKELLHVVNDILNPYNEREAEIEAYFLAEEGWRKVSQGAWIKAECSEKNGDANCSECGHRDWSDCNYCSNCGAEMVERRKNERRKNEMKIIDAQIGDIINVKSTMSEEYCVNPCIRSFETIIDRLGNNWSLTECKEIECTISDTHITKACYQEFAEQLQDEIKYFNRKYNN